MPSNRDRCASPRRERRRDRDRGRDEHNSHDDRDWEKKRKRRREPSLASDEEIARDLKQLGVDEITEEDYLYALVLFHEHGLILVWASA